MKTLRRSRALCVSTLLVATLALAACGDDGEDQPASEPTPTAGSTSEPTDGPVEFTEVGEFADPRLRADQPPAAAPLAEDADVQAWLKPFEASDAFVAEVAGSVRSTVSSDDDASVYGVLLGTGCERPTDYTLERVDGELTVRVAPSKSTVQCLAPMTYLTVVSVDESA